MTEIYLDNAATTRVFDEVTDLVAACMREDYGNPSSMHMKGVTAERYLREARETLARLLKVNEKELIFTSGGTESNNMALIGGVLANPRLGKHIISTRIEHPSVYMPIMHLEQLGYEVTWLPVGRTGLVDLDALAAAVRPDTVLVSVMCVNNEIGTIQPIEDVVRIVREKNSNTLIHMDAIQAFAKLPLYPERLGIDLMSASGHKFHGPKGTGFLWIRDKVKVQPLILGGGQQKAMRSGTDNVPGTAGMARAAMLEMKDLESKCDALYEKRDAFVRGLLDLPGVRINGGISRGSLKMPEDITACAAPHVVSASFEDIRAEVLLHALEERGIYVSSGSACASNHPQISGTLKAIGVEKRFLDATIRFSFSFDTTEEELKTCLEALAQLLPVLRRYVPGGRKKGGRRV